MSSYKRGSAFAHGAASSGVKQLSAKQYKKSVKANPANKYCHWCGVAFTGPPKVVYLNLLYIGERSIGDQHSAALVCMHCLPKRAEIIRQHVMQTGLAGPRPVVRTGV